MRKKVRIGKIWIGGGEPVAIQSMTKCRTEDTDRLLEEIRKLEREGCEIVRVAVPTDEAAQSLRKIRNKIKLPLVADIHYDWRLALRAVEAGVDKIRINPGNIKERGKIKEIVKVCMEREIAMRIGVNTGSLHPEFEKKYGRGVEALVESAVYYVKLVEDMGFTSMVVSVKSSDPVENVIANRLLHQRIPYPLHIGVTEAGPPSWGVLASGAGVGCLLMGGIGDTIRISLTAPSVEEVRVAKRLLTLLGIRKLGPVLVSCPTCGRLEIDLFRVVREVEKKLERIKIPVKVAVMGCSVNGPGEAKDADVGLAGGKKRAVIFRKGEIVRIVDEDKMVDELMKEIKRMEVEYDEGG
ncbi:4-hydroxy-3-methylbut-2-en-1-yl diphosphate synthase [bacterium]|nr:MAG: 4-hydroxy-3-methylbut-2-en-1-yl diphosphate synthase [bacterium]